MPNQWALSHRLRGQKELTHATINVKPMGTISQASMSTWTQALNYECQTNGHYLIGCDVNKNISMQLSISNQWARSHKLQCQHGHNLQTINTKPMGTILSARIFQPGTITSLTVIKVEYIVKLYKFYF